MTQLTPNEALLDAALPHVAFDGWSQATFDAAIRDSGVAPVVAHGLFPRGGVDLALAYHARGDATMVERIAAADLAGLRFREKITQAVRWRIEAAGKSRSGPTWRHIIRPAALGRRRGAGNLGHGGCDLDGVG